MRRMFWTDDHATPERAGMDITNATEAILDQLRQTDNNMDFWRLSARTVRAAGGGGRH